MIKEGARVMTITDTKSSQVWWQWAIMDRLQPLSRLSACRIVKVPKIFESNLKSEEIINFYPIFFVDFVILKSLVIKTAMFYFYFLCIPLVVTRLGKYQKASFF